VVGGQVLRGRSELILALPEPAYVDIEIALSMLHAAESAVAVRAWRRAWSPARSARGNYDRLVQVKRRYDPTNLFHLNHNIPPF